MTTQTVIAGALADDTQMGVGEEDPSPLYASLLGHRTKFFPKEALDQVIRVSVILDDGYCMWSSSLSFSSSFLWRKCRVKYPQFSSLCLSRGVLCEIVLAIAKQLNMPVEN